MAIGKTPSKRFGIVGDNGNKEEEEVGGWQQEVDSGYNPADFIIPGSDHQGHSERVYCRVQPQHARAMSKILAAHKFPFRTTGDLMRWCIVRGVRVLDKMRPMPGFIGAADAINEVLKQQLYMQEFLAMFQTMTSVIQTHIANGAEGEARKMLSVVLGHIRRMEDEPYWRKKAEDEVRLRFGHLMEGGGEEDKLAGEG
jgi:hypothetical protein